MAINNTEQVSSPFFTIKTLVIEVCIILFFTILAIATLDFFNVIDVKALFMERSISSETAKINQVPVSPPSKSGANGKNVQNNPQIQNLIFLSQNKALHYARSVYEFEGRVKSIDTTGGVDSSSKVKYKIRLETYIGSGGAMTSFLYPQEAIDKIKIVDSNNKTLKFEDLKAGNLVIIKTTTATLRQYPNNINEVLITKK